MSSDDASTSFLLSRRSWRRSCPGPARICDPGHAAHAGRALACAGGGPDGCPTRRHQTRIAAPPYDGRLDDAIWKDAPAISDFRQREPAEGQPASEATTVRIAYDDTRLYFGVELRSANPSQIRATELRRDNTLENDDTFSILLDTYHDHRNAFVFRTNARGTRFDGVIRNEGSVNADWDEDWTAATALTGTGWTAEIVIPFKVLRFRNAMPRNGA